MILNWEMPSFRHALGYSFAAHAVLFFVLFVKAAFFSSQPLMLDRAVQVDLVGLPDKVAPQAPLEDLPVEKKTEQATPPPPLPSKDVRRELVKKTEEAVSLKRANKQNSAIKRLEALEKIQKMMENEKKTRAPIRGNQVARGTSLSGLVKMDSDQYLERIDIHVKRNWALPEWLAQSNLRAVVHVLLDSEGYVIRRELSQSSQNAIFDAKVIEAVDKSSPFPKPPDRLASRIEVDGIYLRFPE